MSQLYEVLFNLQRNGQNNLVGVPDSSNTNTSWTSESFEFDKKSKGMKKKDPHIIKFTLVNDETGQDLRFPSDRHEAMWVGKGDVCPTRTSNHDYSVIEPLVVVDDGRTLLALNKNPKKDKWGFTLNFIPPRGDPANSIPWDPIGDNKNGGYGLSSSGLVSYAAVALGAAIVGALATAVALRGLGS